MRTNLFGCFRALAVSAVALTTIPATGMAADMGLRVPGAATVGSCVEIVLTCDNGRQYPLCPISVTLAGELVTASLYTAPHRATYVRLVPMGVGYRYAGKGIWVDGLRNSAVISFSNRNAVACTVDQS